MNIFLVLHPSGNLSVTESNTWIKNFYEPLIELGHEVTFINLRDFCNTYNLKFRSKEYKTKLSEYLLIEFKKSHQKKRHNLILTYFTVNDIEVPTLKELKKTGVPMANFSCNNTHQFDLVKEISRFFDFNLHSEKHAIEKFQNIKANSTWFQLSANPKYYFPIKTERIYEVSFLGSAYSKRPHYILNLAKRNINVHCFGPNWLINKPYPFIKKIKKETERYSKSLKLLFEKNNSKRESLKNSVSEYEILKQLRRKAYNYLHYPPQDFEMNKIINQSCINLGFLEVITEDENYLIKQHLHLREFEIPMTGGLYITNYSEELCEFYEPEKEIVTFKSEDELFDKISYYLKNPTESENIRKNAYLRSINSHTCHIRFKEMLTRLNINE